MFNIRLLLLCFSIFAFAGGAEKGAISKSEIIVFRDNDEYKHWVIVKYALNDLNFGFKKFKKSYKSDIRVDKNGQNIFIACKEYLHCLDLDGNEIWKVKVSKYPISSTVCAEEGFVYIATSESFVEKRDVKTGEIVWKSLISGIARTNPIIIGDRIFVINAVQEIYVFSKTNGSLLWVSHVSAGFNGFAINFNMFTHKNGIGFLGHQKGILFDFSGKKIMETKAYDLPQNNTTFFTSAEDKETFALSSKLGTVIFNKIQSKVKYVEQGGSVAIVDGKVYISNGEDIICEGRKINLALSGMVSNGKTIFGYHNNMFYSINSVIDSAVDSVVNSIVICRQKLHDSPAAIYLVKDCVFLQFKNGKLVCLKV